ncbi:MAG: GNAT family N-acetyltransferase [Caulobacter sp.]|nr:GNAT family N-acetyltransferase [Caulobacter sp.]
MSTPLIRRASPDDARALSRIGAETFVETFGHLYPPEDLAAFLDAAYGLDKTRRDLADPAKAAWLVEVDGEVVGHALAGPCDLPHDEVTPDCGELKRLYVLRRLQGDGTGSRLLAETLAWLERNGPRRLWIGVWSENLGAQRLYGRMGFEKVGEYEFAVGRVLDREFILRRG